jgi:hypothetical protein
MTDSVLARTLLALLKSYPASNAFLIARLAGCPERDAAKALDELERAGAVTSDGARWTLAPAGLEARQSPPMRPEHPVKYRFRRSKQGDRR